MIAKPQKVEQKKMRSQSTASYSKNNSFFLSVLAKDYQNVRLFQSSSVFFLERSEKTVVYLIKINILHTLQKGTLAFLQLLTV